MEVPTLGELIEEVASEFADEYSRLCDRMSAFVSRIRAVHVSTSDLPKESS